ncbi:MAG TPA: hypothetical protein VK869_00955, partial [Rubrobacteraceae bacterium]|nr:hypothetical protein [Rubrobacteraceae bacterium]
GRSTIRSTTPIVADSRRKQLKRRGAMEQTNAEEVKIPAYSGEASLQSGGWLRLLLPERFGSSTR